MNPVNIGKRHSAGSVAIDDLVSSGMEHSEPRCMVKYNFSNCPKPSFENSTLAVMFAESEPEDSFEIAPIVSIEKAKLTPGCK